VIYLFEGTLPLKTFTTAIGSRAIAPSICINRDVKQFVYHTNATRASKPAIRRRGHDVVARHHIHFLAHLQPAFAAVNTTFVGDGYFRAALYEEELYIEVMYKVNYTPQYTDRCRSYWWDTNSRVWVGMKNIRRLIPRAIYKHYARMLRQKRVADMSLR